MEKRPFPFDWPLRLRHRRSHDPKPFDRSSTRGPFERVLVPLDGSMIAEAALPHAITMAKTFGAKIYLLSVTEPPPANHQVDTAEWRLTRAEVRAYLERIATELAGRGVAVETEIAEGRASEQILCIAEARSADLIVLCSHGRGGITEFSLSGTVSKVIRSARTSVLVVRSKAGASSEDVRYTRVMAAVDCTKRSTWAVHIAGSIARAQSAELLLATVVTQPDVLGGAAERLKQAPLLKELMRRQHDMAWRHLEGLREEVASSDLVVRDRIVEAEQIGPALNQLAEEEDCSLIVLSAHGGQPDSDWRFGAVPSLLLEHATRPLLVLQDGARKAGDKLTATEAVPVAGLPLRWT
jgi:nucleotide-binding universal stress UspA family protein